MKKEMGYNEESYEHRPSREFRGLSPSGFFNDRVGLLERFVQQFGGKLTGTITRELKPLVDKIGINARHERVAEFQISNEGRAVVIDYSSTSTVDSFPTGTRYVGKVIFDFGDEQSNVQSDIEKFCKIIFPVDDNILQYL